MRKHLVLSLSLLASTAVFAQNTPTPAPQPKMSNEQKLTMENSQLHLSLIQAQAEREAEPFLKQESDIVKAVLADNPTFSFDPRTGGFVLKSVPVTAPAPSAPAPVKKEDKK